MKKRIRKVRKVVTDKKKPYETKPYEPSKPGDKKDDKSYGSKDEVRLATALIVLLVLLASVVCRKQSSLQQVV